ncbi:MAG TPA: asparaginase [Chitinolyticbacter sp.]|nr:asparaginase [Chitinolyticbacter sp.]
MLVIYTGGTIGMRQGADGLAPEPGWLRGELVRAYPDIDVLEYPTLLDSSSMGPQDWVRIAHDIVAHAAPYDGFLVLHGTDTLAWTAAAIAYQLPGLGKPVALTGAMRPWGTPQGDAERNVRAALALLAGADAPSVSVVFADRAYCATRVRKLDCTSAHAFDTPNAAPLGEFDGEAWRGVATLPVADCGVEMPQPLATKARVVHLVLAPGAQLDWIAAQLERDPPAALLLSTFGSGNLPAHSRLMAVLARLAALIPVINLTSCLRGSVGMGLYAASGPLARAGVWNGGDMTPEAAYVKLHWLLARPGSLASWQAGFETPLAGDRTSA